MSARPLQETPSSAAHDAVHARHARRRAGHSLRLLSLCCTVLIQSAACGTEGSRAPGRDAERRTVRVGVLPWLTNAAVLIAFEEGYFADAGVDVELVRLNGGNSGTPLLASGEMEVVAGPASPGVLNVIARGGALRIVADKAYIPHRDSSDCVNTAVLVRRDLAKAARESGATPTLRRVRRTDTAGLEYFIERAFAAAGIDTTDIEFFRIASTAATLEAMSTGAVDATSTAEPVTTRLLDEGHAVLWDARDHTPGLPYGFILYGPTLLERDREAGIRFMTAYLRGVRQYGAGKTERNIEVLARSLGEEPALLRRACWPPLRSDGRLDTGPLGPFQEWALQRGHLDRIVEPSEYWDPYFVEQALRRLGASNPR